MTALTSADRALIARARELAGIRGPAAVREHTGDSDPLGSYVAALGEAQELLAGLAAIAERPAGQAEDTRRLNAIRGVLAWFDWEHDDRQYALEKIDRIVEGGQA